MPADLNPAPVWSREASDDRGPSPASPCVGICELDEADAVCVGCGRLIGEIAEWSAASEDRRWQILGVAEKRRAAIEASLSPTHFQSSFTSEPGSK